MIKNLYLIKGSPIFFHVAFLRSCRIDFFFCQGDVIADDSHDCESENREKSSPTALQAQIIHYLDASCKWGTHVLRFSWRTYCNFPKVKILFYPCSTCTSSAAHFFHPMVRRFAAPLFKVFIFFLLHFRLRRSSALLCKNLLLRPIVA